MKLSVERVGHAGIWVDDLARMREFYTSLLDFEVIDEDPEAGIVFIGAQPTEQGRMTVLARGRASARALRELNRISWRLATPDDVRTLRRRLAEEGLPSGDATSGAGAVGISFHDPEGNLNEAHYLAGDH